MQADNDRNECSGRDGAEHTNSHQLSEQDADLVLEEDGLEVVNGGGMNLDTMLRIFTFHMKKQQNS